MTTSTDQAAGEVRAVSIGQPEWRDVAGRQVFTSIVRPPSPEPVWFGEEGPAGNATAVHTEQVLAFCAEHYDYWAETLGAQRRSWDWCHWGENLTLTGLDENALAIGARLRIGEALLEVTSPRIPCFKLAWRIGRPDSVLAEIAAKGWVGVYLRVLESGWIGAGDPVRLEDDPPSAITVGDLSRLLTDPSSNEPAVLRKVLANPALGDQARGMIRKRLTRLEDQAHSRRGRWTGWRSFVIEQVTPDAKGVASFHLRPSDGEELAGALPGQFLAVRLPPDGHGELVRTWSLSDHEPETGAYRLTVRRLDGGRGSGALHALEPGTELQLRPPAGRFVLDRSGFMRVVLISAGIGVTPMLAMLKAHLARGDEIPPLIWIHVARDRRSHVLAEEAARLLDRPGFERHVFYSRPEADAVQGRDHDHAGRPTPERLQDILQPAYRLKPFGREIEIGGEHSEVYICGPGPFETMVRETLAGIGVPPELIRSEGFVAAARSGGAPVLDSAEVRFVRSGLQARWTGDEDLTLLELARSVGLEPPFCCGMGSCQTCETALLAGEAAYDPAPQAEAGPGRVLICCARPASPLVELDL